jgi:hypothetical protein
VLASFFCACACVVGKLLESLLVQTGTHDPVTLTSIVALLVFVSLAACFWPARRGSIRSAHSGTSDALR